MVFKDQFSTQAELYARSRPTYPEELFRYLASLCPAHGLAWDCATGNGQAALSLKNHFERVIATDASSEQIKNAPSASGVDFYIASAYDSKLQDNSADIITVATAAHWFKTDDFYKEADRVLKPGGILAVWGYTSCHVSSAVDALMHEMVHTILKDHWTPEYWIVDNKYRDLSFPYPEIAHPPFSCRMQWDMEQLVNYMLSWSGSQNYIKAVGSNPAELILPRLREAWGDPAEKKPLEWELYLKTGRKNTTN